MFFCRENRARFEAANGIGALRDETGHFLTGIILTKALFSHMFPPQENLPGSESSLEIRAGINGEVAGEQILQSLRALSSLKLCSMGFICPGASSSAEEELLFAHHLAHSISSKAHLLELPD